MPCQCNRVQCPECGWGIERDDPDRFRCEHPHYAAPVPANLQDAIAEITKLRYRVAELEKKKVCKCPDTYWHFASGCADE